MLAEAVSARVEAAEKEATGRIMLHCGLKGDGFKLNDFTQGRTRKNNKQRH